ncbi:MAG: cobalamin-dependent protein, partial [Chloroflexota bacterium]
MMKIVLLFPPNWTPSMPHLALPTLTAFLRERGIEVIQRDLNATTFDEILTREYLLKSLARLREDYGTDANRHPQDRRGLPKRDHVLWALKQGEQLAQEVEQAKAIIRSERFFDGEISLPAFETIIQSLEVASLPFYPASLTLQTYVSASPTDSSAALLQAVKDENHNIFLDLFRNGILKEIEREKPDIVGISIPSMPQMLAGMTLAYLVKNAGLDCHVTVGGPHISMLRDELAKVPAMFSLFDSAVVFDGEVPLLNLAQALEGNGDLSQVPNLVYRDGDTIRVTERKTPEKINDLPLPDF